jgi:PHP family Zn ribbon phosphoesterase
LISAFGSEFNVLFRTKKEDLVRVVSNDIANAIIKNRNGEIEIIPGYDGEYGVPVLSKKVEKTEIKNK